MQAQDVHALRVASSATACVAVPAVVAGLLGSGATGAASALLGVLVVLAFFGLSLAVVAVAAVRVSPAMLMQLGLLSYVVRVLALGGLLRLLGDASFLSRPAFAWTIVGATVVWVVAEVAYLWRAKLPYVVPVGEG